MSTELQELLNEIQAEACDLDASDITESLDAATSCETASDLHENLKDARRAAISLAGEIETLIRKLGAKP